MARPCPTCKRPNNERAARCIYCGTAFPEPAPAATEKKSPPSPEAKAPTKEVKEARPKPPEVYQVVISPRQEPSAPGLESFAQELELDTYTARQKLKRPAPWVARVFPDPQSSGALAQAFMAMGLDSYVVKQSGIDRISDRVQVMGLKEIKDRVVIFLDGQGDEVLLSYDDLFFIVRGRIRQQAEREEDMDEESPAVALGKIAVGSEASGDKGRIREAIERIEVRPRPYLLRWVLKGHTVEIMDIYRKSSPRSVRVVETEFDYSGLGEDMTPSGLINYSAILNTLTRNNPACPVDTTFNTVGYTLRETPKEDKMRAELDSLLGATDSMKKIFDNRAFFDDYSARLYLHLLRERSRNKQQATDRK